MLYHLSTAILVPSSGILEPLPDPFSRNDELGMRDTRGANLETSTLKLVLRVDFTKVPPRWSFAVACRDRLKVSFEGFRIQGKLTG